MGREIIFLSESSDYSTIKKANDVEIITLDYNSHKNLQQLGIKHSNAEVTVVKNYFNNQYGLSVRCVKD